MSLDYLLSDDFASLARSRTMLDNPTFIDMKSSFWLQNDPIGNDVVCPRDWRMGCALVDWIPRVHRREQTHFMSWSWMYSLEQLCGALKVFMRNRSMHGDRVFFFMCFFVNNQFRIIVDGSSAGSDDLENVFKPTLTRIGRMVAVLDTWQDPIYLQRIWTVYEQYVACSLEIPVTFVMPQSSMSSLQTRISHGKTGLQEITLSVSKVSSADAKAWDERDAVKVKSIIQQTVGFERVNRHVIKAMLDWIGLVVRSQFEELVDEALAPDESTVVSL